MAARAFPCCTVGPPVRSCSLTSPSTATAGSPIGGAGLTDAIPRLRERVAEAGRDPEDLEIVPFGSVPDPGKLDHFERIGVTECVFRLPSAPRDVVLPLLDEQAALVASRA